eukprot:CAMPEP_0113844048 /NCGR_PEP_ID=MMETSP0372-20130328/40_1 /TAXON_ID=340204 /ORGANISM="Lankesteria abbotti" /LENGTH=422 /DNA_ID=CAMNT_0000813047 /DNA_START=401 /DNA_END=1666 /DNA_ORIENTATION=+ /assembly_acc=CAM_ASM_000359
MMVETRLIAAVSDPNVCKRRKVCADGMRTGAVNTGIQTRQATEKKHDAELLQQEFVGQHRFVQSHACVTRGRGGGTKRGNPQSDNTDLIEPLKQVAAADDSDRNQLIQNSRVSVGVFDDMFLSECESSGGVEIDRVVVESQPVFLAWREMERKVPTPHWQPCFDAYADIESIRVSCVESIFKYVCKRQLGLTTLHLTSHYLNRLFHYFAVEKGAFGVGTNFHCLALAAGVSMRTAVKMQEQLHHVDPFRSRPSHIWEDFGFAQEMSQMKNLGGADSVELLNQMERVHIHVLEKETLLNVPVVSDFLDQYLMIGGWPSSTANSYRGLGQFILARTLLVTGKPNNLLKGVPPSKLAAGALVLAVKIVNSNFANQPFEFWTKKLEHFTQYSMTTIQPVMQALCKVLRNAPSQSQTEVLKKMFPEW